MPPTQPLPTSGDFTGQGLACRRGEKLLFRGLDFALPPGGALVLTGPNGSGKSSLLRLMAGLTPLEAGTLWPGTVPIIRDEPASHRARLHFIGHRDALKPVLSAGEMPALLGRAARRRARIDAGALAHFGLAVRPTCRAGYLSAGQTPAAGLGAAGREPGAALAARRAADRPRQRSRWRSFSSAIADHRPGRRHGRAVDPRAARASRCRDLSPGRFPAAAAQTRQDDCRMSPFLPLVARDLRLALRQGGDAAMVIAFFVLTVVLFPFGVGPEPELLQRIAAGIVWVTALLAALLSLERLFQADYEDGSLEALALLPLPLEAQVLAKCLAHWLVTGLPLIVVAPLLGAAAASRPPRAIRR